MRRSLEQLKSDVGEISWTVRVSLTLPLAPEPVETIGLHPFFDGLVPEGWLLDIAARNWKLDPRDRVGLLLNLCSECIGAVRVLPW
jgi:serine/threonine-protein kinase HipA